VITALMRQIVTPPIINANITETLINFQEIIVELTNKLSIGLYLQCALCLEEIPDGVSPEEFAEQSVGWTELGLQVWCSRHKCNIVHIDFEGQTHPADTSRKFRRSDIKAV